VQYLIFLLNLHHTQRADIVENRVIAEDDSNDVVVIITLAAASFPWAAHKFPIRRRRNRTSFSERNRSCCWPG